MRLQTLLNEQQTLITESENYKPPKDVQRAAKNGLELRKQTKGGTSVGVARARDLSNGKSVSFSTIKRMHSYFQRHSVDKNAKGWNQGEDGYPSKGRVAWECVSGDTNILLADGSIMPIKDIVESEESFEVMSLNEESGEFEPKPVIAKHVNESSYTDFCKVVLDSYLRSGFDNRRNVVCTPDHEFYCEGEWIPASDMKGKFATGVISTFDPVMEQVLRGSLLGDGCLHGKHSKRFKESHGEPQREYIDEKLRLLGPLEPNKIENIATAGYGSGKPRISICTRSLKCLNELYDEYYSDQKIVTIDLLKNLSDIGLAFWFMDDGSLHKTNGSSSKYYRLHTEGFDKESIDRIVEWFSYDGIEARPTLRENTDGHALYFSPADSRKIALRIAPFICPSMRFKLPEEFSNITYSLEDYVPRTMYKTTPVKISGNMMKGDYSRSKQDRTHLTRKYDLTVADNHNFVANSIVVHNCWGGDAGKRWAASIMNRVDESAIITEDTVKWDWQGTETSGKVKETYTKPVTRKIKGTEIRKRGTEDNPAFLIVQNDGSEVLKLKSELKNK